MRRREYSIVVSTISALYFSFGSPACLAQAQQKYQEIEVIKGGSVSGVVKFIGDPPAPRKMRVDKNPEHCGKFKLSEEYIIHAANEGLKNVVVSIDGITRGKKIAEQSDTIENKDCKFHPHVQAIIAGRMVEIVNSDPILHTTHAKYDGKITVFNLALPPLASGGQLRVKRPFRKTGLIKFNCEVHSWMSAYIVAFNHPYFAMTDGDGSYEIEDIPPGTYKVKVWHEALGEQVEEVVITENGKLMVDFKFIKEDESN